MTLALIGALLIGTSLGLLGSGGSILTVPVLVYLVGQDEKVAIAGSLAIVGLVAAMGSVPYARRSLVSWHSVALFAPPGMAGTWIGAWLSQFVSGGTQLLLFAGVMVLVAFMMLRGTEASSGNSKPRAFWKIGLDGLGVGILTGLVGVGGGFLIIPALVLLGGLPMRQAVGTSLVIIALKSASGFWKYLAVLESLDLAVDWKVVGIFSAVGAVGTLLGTELSRRLPQLAVRRAFGVLLVFMSVSIVWTQLASEPSPAPATESTPPAFGEK